MAKKRVELDTDEAAQYFENSDPATPTAPQKAAVALDDPESSFEVDLLASEWQRLDDIAAEMGITRHEAAALAVRAFLKQYEAPRNQIVKKPRSRVCRMRRDKIQLILLSTYFKIFD
jgi:hypothetical protein